MVTVALKMVGCMFIVYLTAMGWLCVFVVCLTAMGWLCVFVVCLTYGVMIYVCYLPNLWGDVVCLLFT